MTSNSRTPIIIVVSIIALGSLALFLVLTLLIKNQAPIDDPDGMASQSAIEQGNTEREKYPLLAHLPINNAVYNIGYQFESDGTPTIIIDTTEYYRDFALEKLKSFGDISAYKIKFVNRYE